MSKKPKQQITRKSLGQDPALHETLPKQTKELLELKAHPEKAIGPEQLVLTREIEEKAREPQP
jgi:hypothetical protein